MSDPILTRQEAEVVRLYRAQWGAQEIADKLGVKIRTVFQTARNAKAKGAVFPRQPVKGSPRKVDWSAVAQLAREGLTGREIARKLGVGEGSVSRILKHQREVGVRLPPKEPNGFRRRSVDHSEVAALYLEGLPHIAIGERLNVPEATIRSVVQNIRIRGEGLPYRRPPRRPVMQAPNEVEQQVAQADRSPNAIRCMRCKCDAPTDAPRWFVCTDCKRADAGRQFARV
jgi:transposase